MKKTMTYLLTIFCVCLSFTGLAWADAGFDWYESSSVDYDVTVAAPDGYVNVRYGPGTEYDIITSAENGTVIHIEEEATASNGQRWGHGTCNGSYGWVALSQVKKGGVKAEVKPELKISTLYEGGNAADYSVKVSAPDGGLNLRYGPGSKYEIRISMMPNGTVLDIEKTAKADNGKFWGFTNYNGTYGWIYLNETTTIEKAEPAAEPDAKVVESDETSEGTELLPDDPDQLEQNTDQISKSQNSSLFYNPLSMFIPLVIIAVLLAGILTALIIRRK